MLPAGVLPFMPLGTSFGYPVATADELGLTDYFRKNPKVAGMAWGGGLNGSPKDEPRVIVANPFNAQIAKPEKMQGLLKIEAARHLMDETGYTPEFDLSEEQQEWRKNLGKYADDDLAAKQTVISRIMVNDRVPGVTPEQKAEAMRFNALLDEKENPDFVKTIVKNITAPEKAPEEQRAQEVKEASGFLKDWYGNRKITDPFIQEGFLLDKPAIDRNLNNPPEVKIAKNIESGTAADGVKVTGQFDLGKNLLTMTPDAPSYTALHEMTHQVNQVGNGGGYMRSIHKTLAENELKKPEELSGDLKDKYDYFSNPDEVHARVMVLRKAAGFRPDQSVKEEDLDKFLNDYDGKNGNINDLLNLTKDKKGILNLLNFMAAAPSPKGGRLV